MQAPDIRAKVSDHTLAAVVLALLLTIAVAVAALAVTDRLPGVSTAADQPAAVQAPSHAMSADIEFVEINTFLPAVASDNPARVTTEEIQFVEDNTFSYSGGTEGLPSSSDPKRVDY